MGLESNLWPTTHIARATLNRPHLLRVVADSDSVRQVSVIEGNAIRKIPWRSGANDGGYRLWGSRWFGSELGFVSGNDRERLPQGKNALNAVGGRDRFGASRLYLVSNRYNFYSASTTAELEGPPERPTQWCRPSRWLRGGVEFAGIRLGWSGHGAMIGRGSEFPTL